MAETNKPDLDKCRKCRRPVDYIMCLDIEREARTRAGQPSRYEFGAIHVDDTNVDTILVFKDALSLRTQQRVRRELADGCQKKRVTAAKG